MDREAALFGPGDASWDSVGDRRFALMFGSAFALQLMHPQIASAVSKLSTFVTDPWGRAERSLESVQRWVYAGRGALDEADRLRRMHAPMRGVDASGRAFDALDPGAWAWVPLTGFYASVVGHPVFYGRPLTKEEEQIAFDELARLCCILHVDEALVPKSIAAYWAYFDDMVERTLEDHAVVHSYISVLRGAPPPGPASRLLGPLWPIAQRLGAELSRLTVVGLLPERVRAKLGVSWSARDARDLARLGRVVSTVFPRLPDRLRLMPMAYRARRAAAAGAAPRATPRGA